MREKVSHTTSEEHPNPDLQLVVYNNSNLSNETPHTQTTHDGESYKHKENSTQGVSPPTDASLSSSILANAQVSQKYVQKVNTPAVGDISWGSPPRSKKESSTGQWRRKARDKGKDVTEDMDSNPYSGIKRQI